MKITTKTITELIFTLFVALILSSLLAMVLTFIFANLDVLSKAQPGIDAATYILLGLIVGYKAHSILFAKPAPRNKKK